MKDIIAGFRQIVKDLLVPELKSIQVELKHHSEILQHHGELFEKVFHELENLKIGQTRLEEGQEKILDKLDLDKRVTKIETIIERAGLCTSMIGEKGGKYKTK
ncbi:MAG: hypothetical protein V1833_07470 [Elusimicrobiota bacterium]